MTINLSVREVKAYLAGLMDGEGSFMIRKRNAPNRTQYMPAVSIAMTDRDGIDLISSIYGGAIHITTLSPGHNAQPYYNWRVDSKNKIVNILSDILPYLRVKRTQAVLLLEYISKFSHGKGCAFSDDERLEQDLYYQICTRLNGRGTDSTDIKVRLRAVL